MFIQPRSSSETSLAIEAYAHSLRLSFIYLMIVVALGSLLVPFLFALFYFSKASQRKAPMFICVAISVSLAIIQAINMTVIQSKLFLQPFVVTPGHVMLFAIFLDELPNFTADLALLCRIWAVYPFSTTPRKKFLAIFTPAITLKVIRVACIALMLSWGHTSKFTSSATHVGLGAHGRISTVLDRAITALDNSYTTGIFLRKLWRTAFHAPQNVISTGNRDSMSSRVRTLFWLAMSSFVIPVPVCFAQLGLAAVPGTSAILYAIFQCVFNFTSAVCVAFATIWSSSAPSRDSARSSRPRTSGQMSSLHFQNGKVERTSPTREETGFAVELNPIRKPKERPQQLHVDWSSDMS